MVDKPFYSVNEIAKFLCVSRETIARAVRTGEIPSMKIGRQYRVSKVDLEAYLKKLQDHDQGN